MTPKLIDITTFPIKGLNCIHHKRIELQPGKALSDDRKLALVKDNSNAIDAAKGKWSSARSFYINSLNDGLMGLKLSHLSANSYLISSTHGEITIDDIKSADLDTLNKTLPALCDGVLQIDPDAPPKLVCREPDENGTGFHDYTDTPISIMNKASIDEIAKRADVPLDPVRFRGNLLIDGLAPFEEFSLVGTRIKIGSVEIEITRPINRCDAPSVNPQTGERDPPLATILAHQFGHPWCGIYGRVVKAGAVNVDNALEIGLASQSPVSAGFNDMAPPYERWPKFMKIEEYTLGESQTNLTLAAITPLDLPRAQPGSKFRIHLPQDLSRERDWTSLKAVEVSKDAIRFAIPPSRTSDPVTEFLRQNLKPGGRLLVSGPYG